MAIAEVEKVQIIAHESIKMELLSLLQEQGLIQLEKADFEELDLRSSSPEISSIDHELQRLSHALEYLSLWEEKGFVKKILEPKPQVPLRKRMEVLHFDYLSLLEKIEEIEAKKNELLSEIKFLQREKESLFPLENLDVPIKSLKPTDSTEILLGRLPLSQLEEFEERIVEEPVWYMVIDRGRRDVSLLLIYLRKEKVLIENLTRELDLTPFFFTDSVMEFVDEEDRVSDVIRKIEEEVEERRKTQKELDAEGQRLVVHKEELMSVHDVLLNEREKISSSSLLGETERVFYLEGWAKSSDIRRVRKMLEPFEEFSEIHTRLPHPDEDPPVILENPTPARPFEMVTKLYGLPLRKTLDPTLWLAPFFFIFVGICVSEAGYGLLVALMSFLFIKFAKPKGGFLSFLKLLFLLGISTVILGTLIGGWFGFPVRRLMVLDPLQDPLSFLILSLVLGFIQVWFGTLLNMINGIKNRNYLQAVPVQGGWLLLLPALVLYLVTKVPLWGVLTLVGAAGVVLFSSPSRNPFARVFGGLYSLYDISRYLADVLSYSRLLALGLATSVIAMVVNTLCQTALGIPVLGWVLAVLIFIGGHLFNLGISFLGGFVHSMRLQFVEFFSKFFKSGGRPFKPFSLESKYVEFI
ncbi:MAG: V-type ATP synthase subunit I [Candidatus Aminicenantales bacterium]